MTHSTLPARRSIAIALLSVFSFGCQQGDHHAVHAADAAPPAQVQLLILQDKTSSVAQNGVPALTPVLLKQFAEQVRVSGGDMAFGIIDDVSVQPFVRLSLVPPPIVDIRNPYNRPAALAAEARHLAQANQQIEEFVRQATPLLNRPSTAKKTNVATAMMRANTFFGEETNSSRRFLVVISDLEHDANRNRVPALTAKVTPLVIAGVTRPPFPNARYFEAPSAALRFLQNNTQGAL